MTLTVTELDVALALLVVSSGIAAAGIAVMLGAAVLAWMLER